MLGPRTCHKDEIKVTMSITPKITSKSPYSKCEEELPVLAPLEDLPSDSSLSFFVPVDMIYSSTARARLFFLSFFSPSTTNREASRKEINV